MISQINCAKLVLVKQWALTFSQTNSTTKKFTVKSMECDFEGKHNGVNDRVRSTHVSNGTLILTPLVTTDESLTTKLSLIYLQADILKGSKHILGPLTSWFPKLLCAIQPDKPFWHLFIFKCHLYFPMILVRRRRRREYGEVLGRRESPCFPQTL